MKNKIKVLGIAPYEAMKANMLKLARERKDIDLTVYVGDLDQGVKIAKSNFHSNYDAIISRGGTAEMITSITRIPVIEIDLSVYDVLRALKLAENYSNRYAIVGFSSITNNAHLLCDLLQYKIDIFTIHNVDEVYKTLNDLKSHGYRMVLGDMVTNTIAKELSLDAILITSGNESILNAFHQTVKLCSTYMNLKEENLFLTDIFREQSSHTVIFDSHQNLYFSTLDQKNSRDILELLKNNLQKDLSNGVHKFFKKIDNTLYSITRKKNFTYRNNYTVYFLSHNNIPLISSKNGISFTTKRDVEDSFSNNFYGVIDSTNDLEYTIDQINQSNFPVMIIGEHGTRKGQIARMIYSRSTFSHNPLVTINCSLLNDRSWNFLTNHYNSPFNDNNNTIYFKGIDSLIASKQKQLLSHIIDMDLCRRNKILFSCISHPEKALPHIIIEYINLLSCFSLNLSPLRDRLDEIPTLFSLYLNTLNVTLSKQIIGFEADALELLHQYNWPHNYTQFKRILNELSVITTTPYIHAANVAAVLEKERLNYISPDINEDRLDLSKTLYEINQEVIYQVLKEADGNQSSTAKRLGISRTTLWRYLKAQD